MQHPWMDMIKVGAVVRSTDGHKIGKVTHLVDGGFGIEKGLLLPTDFMAAYEEIVAVKEGEVILARRSDRYLVPSEVPLAPPAARPRFAAARGDDLRGERRPVARNTISEVRARGLTTNRGMPSSDIMPTTAGGRRGGGTGFTP